jgi:hypothetical protein
MNAAWRSSAAAVVADLRMIFGERLRSVAAYGAHVEGATEMPLRLLALVTSLSSTDLDACARQATRWQRARVAVPLIIPEQEFNQSLDAFPLEYGEILRSHQLVFGDDPFAGITIALTDVRRACETQIKSHLIHLREGYIQAGGDPAAIADLVSGSAPAFAALLRHVARLTDGTSADRHEATTRGARAAQLPERVVADVIAMEHAAATPTVDAARLFPEYLAAVEQLSRTVDTWRA